MQISAVIIAQNEADSIADAIRSVDWADEVVVVDSGSTDDTCDIAEKLGALVIQEDWRGFGRQKQFAAESATYDYIFSLDADERASSELKRELIALKDSVAEADGYRIPRLATYMGREIRHGGWYPDAQVRLFDRRKGRWKDVVVHESVEMAPDAKLKLLEGNIIHLTGEGGAEHARMIQTRYAPLAAEAMRAAGKTTSPARVAFSPVVAFLRGYFLKAGFLDGFPGLCIAYFGAYNVFLKHLLLWQLQKQGDSDPR